MEKEGEERERSGKKRGNKRNKRIAYRTETNKEIGKTRVMKEIKRRETKAERRKINK